MCSSDIISTEGAPSSKINILTQVSLIILFLPVINKLSIHSDFEAAVYLGFKILLRQHVIISELQELFFLPYNDSSLVDAVISPEKNPQAFLLHSPDLDKIKTRGNKIALLYYVKGDRDKFFTEGVS